MFCGRKNIKKLENLQERALRFVYGDKLSTYEDLLEKGNYLSLSVYRIYFLAIAVFKCSKGRNPDYMSGLFEKKQLTYNLRDSDLIIQSKFNTFTYGYKSFSYYGAKIWNALSPDIKRSETLYLNLN